MNDTIKPAQRPEFAALMARLNLDEPRAAAYLGVPVFTFRKWLNWERTPSASVARLLEVLGTLEALAPALHDSFLPPASQATPRTRGRVKKLPSETRHVEKSRSTDSIGSSADLVMSKNPV